MKGVAIEKVGVSAVVVDNLEKPEPADDQVLVKSIYTAMNPIDGYMAGTGLLVVDWPFILGCDAAGVIVKAGSHAVGPLGPLKVGDEVCGCTRLGMKGYSTCQEFFLMDAALATPKPKNISTVQAATVGVGFYTAVLGVFNGLHIPVPDPSNLPTPSSEWAVVTGGASSVGKYAVQLLKALGFKVAATCSIKSAEVLKSIGADATIDYKKSEDDQVAELLSITGGKVNRIFDAVATAEGFAKAVFKKIEAEDKGFVKAVLNKVKHENKYFCTTNDWTPMPASDFSGATPSPVKLGPIGRADATELNKEISSYIPLIVKLMEDGKVVPSEYEVIGKTGFDSVIEAWAYQSAGKGGNKKVVVKLQDA